MSTHAHPFRQIAVTLTFNGWIDPPIGYDMDDTIDPDHSHYRVRTMRCDLDGTTYEIPLVDFVANASDDSPASLTRVQIPTLGVSRSTGPNLDDCTVLLYYDTMTVEYADGSTVRHRVFNGQAQDNCSLVFTCIEPSAVAENFAIFLVEGIEGVGDIYFQLYQINNSRSVRSVGVLYAAAPPAALSSGL